MGTYNLPRNVKGEGRILFIFSSKSLVYTAIAAAIGMIFYLIFSLLGMTLVGIGIVAIFAFIGFAIGTFKVPEMTTFNFSKKTGGENIDDVIKRAIKFKMRRKQNLHIRGGNKR